MLNYVENYQSVFFKNLYKRHLDRVKSIVIL